MVALCKLELAGYVKIKKGFIGKKPHTVARLTDKGREAFEAYGRSMKQVLHDLPG